MLKIEKRVIFASLINNQSCQFIFCVQIDVIQYELEYDHNVEICLVIEVPRLWTSHATNSIGLHTCIIWSVEDLPVANFELKP